MDLEALLAMSNTELEAHAGTLEAKSFVGRGPWILDDLDDLHGQLAMLTKSDLSDAGVVRQIAYLRRCIAYKEAVERGEDRDDAWAKAFDRPVEEIKRIQRRAAEIAAGFHTKH